MILTSASRALNLSLSRSRTSAERRAALPRACFCSISAARTVPRSSIACWRAAAASAAACSAIAAAAAASSSLAPASAPSERVELGANRFAVAGVTVTRFVVGMATPYECDTLGAKRSPVTV